MPSEDEKAPSDSVRDRTMLAARIIGPYRLFIDGAMIVTMATLLVQASSWKTEVDMRIGANAENNQLIFSRLEKVERQPITAEADVRLRVLETSLGVRLDGIEKRFDGLEKRAMRMEDKIDNIPKKVRSDGQD